MPTKDSNILTARVDNELIKIARAVAEKKGITINKLMNKALQNYIYLDFIIRN
jgi:predicted HicB family RNase H-like nuclease